MNKEQSIVEKFRQYLRDKDISFNINEEGIFKDHLIDTTEQEVVHAFQEFIKQEEINNSLIIVSNGKTN